MNPHGVTPPKKHVISFKKLVVPVGMRSIYWKYFGFPGNEDGEILTREKIICTLCKIQMAYNGNTSNLRMHLQNKHAPHLLNLEATSPPYIPKSRKVKLPTKRHNSDVNPIVHPISMDGAMMELASNSQSTCVKYISIDNDVNDGSNVEFINTQTLADNVTYYIPSEGSSGRGETNELGDALLRFCSSELLPPCIIEGAGFQRLVAKLNPSVALPSTKQMEEDIIPQQYDDLKNGIMSELDSLTELSLSIEEWSGVNDKIFFTISAHFLNDEQLVTRTLPTLPWNQQDPEIIEKTLEHWGINRERITSILVATSQQSLTEALEKLAPIIPCFLFTLQQAVSDCFAIPQVDTLIDSCRTILTSLKLHQSLEEDETANYNSYNIHQDYPNLWTSTYDMLQEFVNNKEEIASLTADSTKKLSTNDWSNLTIIVDVLSPFKVTVQTLQEENPALVSIIKPLLWQLITNYLQTKTEDTAFTTRLKELLKSRLSSAYKKNSMLLEMATTLDPRFRQLSYATEKETELIHTNIKNTLATIVAESGDANVSTSSQPSGPKKKVSGMELLLGDLCSPNKQEIRPKDRAELELNQYISETPVAFDENPLTWWHGAESKCPNLVKLAKRYTCIPACVVPTYRIPIRQREFFERQRATLSTELVDKMIFLNGNLI